MDAGRFLAAASLRVGYYCAPASPLPAGVRMTSSECYSDCRSWNTLLHELAELPFVSAAEVGEGLAVLVAVGTGVFALEKANAELVRRD